MDECGSHQQIVEWLNKLIESFGRYDVHFHTSQTNQNQMFDKLRELQSAIDKREVLSNEMAKQVERLVMIAEGNLAAISKLKDTVENGLSDRTRNIETSVLTLRKTMEVAERDKELQQALKEAGFVGFFSKSWTDFKTKFGWVVIVILIWLFVWGFGRAMIFHESPFPYIKYFSNQPQKQGNSNDRSISR